MPNGVRTHRNHPVRACAEDLVSGMIDPVLDGNHLGSWSFALQHHSKRRPTNWSGASHMSTTDRHRVVAKRRYSGP